MIRSFQAGAAALAIPAALLLTACAPQQTCEQALGTPNKAAIDAAAAGLEVEQEINGGNTECVVFGDRWVDAETIEGDDD